MNAVQTPHILHINWMFAGKIAFMLALLASIATRVNATTIFVGNASFETPITTFADPAMDEWQKSPQPFWFPPGTNSWDQTMGQFMNPPDGYPNRITNADGRQAAFIFAVPDAAIFQDLNTFVSTNSPPSHQFNAQYEAGKSYALTIGVLGNGGGMVDGVQLEISLYYRDLSNNIVTVGATTITNSATLFPTNTYLTDFQVWLPRVKASDAWAGKRIGIQIASKATFFNQGGYWDIDNVRLTESVLPNYSFEEPVTPFAGPEMDAWQKSPQPFWWPPGTNTWDQTMGQFLNPPIGSPGHIDNAEGNQAAFLFALPDAYIFQDYNSFTGTNAPTHDFTATYEIGKSYALTVSVLGNGGGMVSGVPLQLSLYYRDNSSNMVTVASTTISNSASLFPTNTHFLDFLVLVPTVRTGQAWAGKNIGIKIASLADFLNQGGYWDLDNVRLVESPVANNSFESPVTPFAGPEMDGWQKSPQPFWFPPGTNSWDQTMGQFLNTPTGSPGHIDNMEGSQAAYLFALPDVAIFQDYTTTVETNAPTHDMIAKYEVGRSYNLTVAVLGGGGGMLSGVELELSLYYGDASSNKVIVASTTVANSSDLFPTNTAFTDFEVTLPTVRNSDAWAGKYIGVQIASKANFLNQGGYWDVDNVRLQSVRDPFLKDPVKSGSQFQLTVDSAPGRLEILASTNAAAPLSTWISLGTITNLTGNIQFTDSNALTRRFYHARQVP